MASEDDTLLQPPPTISTELRGGTSTVVSGPQLEVIVGVDKGSVFRVGEGETRVGRGVDNDIVLGDLSVSRNHIVLVWDGSRCLVRDLGSGNGTHVGGKLVREAALDNLEEISIGETVLRVGLPPAQQATQALTLPRGSTAEKVAELRERVSYLGEKARLEGSRFYRRADDWLGQRLGRWGGDAQTRRMVLLSSIGAAICAGLTGLLLRACLG